MSSKGRFTEDNIDLPSRVIWIPKSFFEMIKPFENEKVLVKIMSTNTKVTMVEGGKLLTRNNKKE